MVPPNRMFLKGEKMSRLTCSLPIGDDLHVEAIDHSGSFHGRYDDGAVRIVPPAQDDDLPEQWDRVPESTGQGRPLDELIV